MEERYKIAFKNDFIKRSLRDVADKDYIVARIAHRYGLYIQFLWFSLQAIEKYLKAILLYNGLSAKGLSHNIYKAYQKVLQIPDIKFDFTKDIEKFIKFFYDEGENRYFEFPSSLEGYDCLQLDKTVWHIRRYCQYIRGTVEIKGKHIAQFPCLLKQIQDKKYFNRPNRFKIFNGYLENVLKNKKSELRKQLVWKNFYYGTYTKKTIKYAPHITWTCPTHYMHKDIYPELQKVIDFSKPVKEYFDKLLKTQSRGR